MNNKIYSVFDIIGPKMIGPSSSHTAGAARIGRVARRISRDVIKKVTFYLHGSFASTYRGHGTDRALIGGVLGLQPNDEN
ncbi:MAG: L-serine ammonia-lyase, iron-sulfur-dependent, subunit beta, partial [Epulopiscium sp.]|nr:L-serine ammonia-lyase, iron-sulfur-dependent, subunit beta [Candidatus Epulonipiscium sp.]